MLTIERRGQYAAFAALSLWAVGLTGILARSHAILFQPYFGDADPRLMVLTLIGAGGVSLHLLYARGWFDIFKANGRGAAFSAALAALFAAEAIAADLIIRFRQDMNVLPPQALWFYPAMAYVAEIVFHALPMASLLIPLGALLKPLRAARLLWVCIVLTSLLEPTFQLRFAENPISWVGGYLWMHVFAFNIIQLYVFRRYGFVAMYLLRCFYYVYWHIVWGFVRLQVLF